jgi:hypothetical protein
MSATSTTQIDRDERELRVVQWLQRSYRTGAAVDAAAAASASSLPPDCGRCAFPAPSVASEPNSRRHESGRRADVGLDGVAALGGSAAARAQRVLPLTMVVIAGLMANDERARRAGHTWAPQLAPTRLLQLCLILLLGASYLAARRLGT